MQRSAALEHETNGGRHDARHGARSADHNHDIRLTPMREQMRRGARGRSHDEEKKETHGAKSPSDGCSEGEQPGNIDGEMQDTGVKKRMRDECPDRRSPSARP